MDEEVCANSEVWNWRCKKRLFKGVGTKGCSQFLVGSGMCYKCPIQSMFSLERILKLLDNFLKRYINIDSLFQMLEVNNGGVRGEIKTLLKI